MSRRDSLPMPEVVRQRSLLPVDNSVSGWMDDDVASAATQLFANGSGGLLVVDARELLTSTARVVGAQMGELHLKALMAMVTMHVANGMPRSGEGASTIAEFNRLVSGEDRQRGGANTKRLLRALFDLSNAKFTVPGYDMVNQRPARGISQTSLITSLYVDEAMLTAFERSDHHLTRADFGGVYGHKQRGTVAWRLNPDYTERLGDSELRRFDWTKAQRLRGVALALWMVFTSSRVPYRRIEGKSSDLETVQIPLSTEHCQALGVQATTDKDRRRTLNEAGRRVCAADRSFTAFEAHGGRGVESYLRVVRRPPGASPLEAAAELRSEQLMLDAA